MEQQNPKFTGLVKSLEGAAITGVEVPDEVGIMMFEFEGDKELFIHCSWRLAKDGKIIASWNDDIDEEEMNPPVLLLDGLVVKSIEVSPFFDLKITFDKEYQLDVFCDLFSPEEITEFEENWSVCDINNDVCFVVTEQYTVLETKYNTEE